MVIAEDELCRLGHLELKRRTPQGFDDGEAHFNNARAANPSYAPALAGLATVCALRGTYGLKPLPQAYTDAGKFAADAILQSPLLAEAHAIRGFVQTCKRQWREAEISFKLALQMAADLNQPEALAQSRHWYSIFLTQQARFAEALTEIDAACTYGSVWTAAKAQRGAVLVLSGQYDQAVSFLNGLLAKNPDFGTGFRFLAQAYTHWGPTGAPDAYDQADTNLKNAVSLGHVPEDDPDLMEDRGYLFAEQGSSSAAESIAGQLEDRWPTNKSVANNIATIYAGLRNDPTYAKAKLWLDRAVANEDPDLGYLNVDPKWSRARTVSSINSLLISLNAPTP